MVNLISIKKQTENKYVNMYSAKYITDRGELDYNFASRRTPENLDIYNKQLTDGVRILPYFYKNAKINVIIIKEFRFPINDFIYSIPAGLTNSGETLIDAAKRELREETGADAVKIIQTDEGSYTSVGLTDEKIACFEAEIKLSGKQELDLEENIEVQIVDLEKLKTMLDNEHFDFQSRFQLKTFYYKKLSEKQ